MTLDDAVKAHVAWKVRLQSYLAGHGEKFDAVKVAQDCHCDLGRWIHGDGMRHALAPEYRVLRDEHAAFHKEAARVIVTNERGDNAGARALLAGAFAERSLRVVIAITDLKRVVGARAA